MKTFLYWSVGGANTVLLKGEWSEEESHSLINQSDVIILNKLI